MGGPRKRKRAREKRAKKAHRLCDTFEVIESIGTYVYEARHLHITTIDECIHIIGTYVTYTCDV